MIDDDFLVSDYSKFYDSVFKVLQTFPYLPNNPLHAALQLWATGKSYKEPRAIS